MNQFKTKDLMVAAALKARDVLMVSYETSNSKYLVFIFEDGDGQCAELEKQYFLGNLMVNAPKFAQCIKELKNLTYAKEDF